MRPLTELPKASLSDLAGVCFDVDDTVTTHGVLDPEAYGALFSLREAGLKLMAVTGRPLGFAELIARTWPVDAAVGENGAGYVARNGRALVTGYWDAQDVRASQQALLSRIRARVERELPEVHLSSDAWARRCDLAFDVGEHVTLPGPLVEQLLSVIRDEGATASVSSIHAHAQVGDHDKARGATRAARDLWALDAHDVAQRFAFVGDSGNDAAAFAFFALTVGVANVVNHLNRLPTPPRFLAQAAQGAGFAEFARTILATRR